MKYQAHEFSYIIYRSYNFSTWELKRNRFEDFQHFVLSKSSVLLEILSGSVTIYTAVI